MKSILILMAIAILLPASAFAGNTNNVSAGGSLELTGLVIGMSPGVYAYYQDDAATDPQWYVAGTMHQGGSFIYGTAQNSTSIFKVAVEKPNELTDLTGAGDATWPTASTDTESETWWSNSGWTR